MALSEYDKINLDSTQQANIKALTQQYDRIKNDALANGGGITADVKAKLDKIHSAAEHIRASGGSYLGGTDGTEYNPITQGDDSAPSTPRLRGASSQADYINSLYNAQKQAALAALKSAYDKNTAALDAQAAKLPGYFQEARNSTAASAEISKANFNEYAAASGLNSGAGGQARLAMNNQLLGSMGSIDSSEAQARNDIDTQRTQLAANYENAKAQAMTNGDLRRAQALYQEAVRVDDSLVNTSANQAGVNLNYWSAANSLYQQQMAQQLAQTQTMAQTLGAYGDFSGYLSLGYTQNQVDQMYHVWAAKNPLLSWALQRWKIYGY